MNMLWWSEGKKSHVHIHEMSHHHAKAALAKLQRGDYLNDNGDEVSSFLADALADSLTRQIRKTEPPPQ